jgi:hypothetical protein
MKGLSKEIELALTTIIEGLNYNFFAPDGTNPEELDAIDIEEYVQNLDPDRMKQIMNSKTSSFNSAKKILDRWMSSPNAPSSDVVKDYIERLIYAGDSAIGILRQALAGSINFDNLDAHKHDAAIKAKPLILESIFDLDYSVRELRNKIEDDDLSLAEREFIIGYPERFGRGDFFRLEDYFPDWHNKRSDAVRICPFSTSGKMITLDNFKIQLPKVPKDKKKILFSDLPKKDQYWRRLDVPKGITPDNKDLWDDYIKEEFRRRREGIWFMNNGEPVYLTGHHYFALQWCKMIDTGGYMNFRYAQLNMFYHIQGCLVDDRSLGQLFVKSRRTGFTYILLSVILNLSTSTRNNPFGMTSKSDTDAKKAFLKFRYMLLSLPFFFTPLIRGKLDSPKEFEFANPLSNSKEAKKSRLNNIDDYLNNIVDYLPTKEDSYDGQFLKIYLGDEAFKWKKPNDYIKHFGQVTPTMHEGGEVVGKAFIGSTVGAMSKGGSQGKEMYYSSDITRRNPVTNMTVTGLYSYFLPAQDNMTSFIDRYGVCHKERPSKNTKNVKGKVIKYGSIEYLMSQEDAKRSEDDKALNEQYRAYPRTIEHAFRDEASECIFNLTKLYEQIEHNDTLTDKDGYTVGDFNWEDGIVDSNVVFNPNSRGRFKVWWMPSMADGTEHLQNKVKEVGGKFYPLNLNLVRFGCDPFSYKSTHGKGSKGGVHGKTVTLPDEDISNNLKNKFVVEYIARPPDEFIFFEDVIKVIRFYGAPILVESNRLDLLRHMYNRGYRGFAMNRLDRSQRKLNDNEKKYGGQMMSGQDMLDSHMGAIGTWIENYVGVYNDEIQNIRPIGEMGVMPFNETLKDWIAFDPDRRTEFDATISSGLAIMACQKEKYKSRVTPKKKVNVGQILKKYSNRGSIGAAINNRY